MGAEGDNNPAKILYILKQNWEEHQDAAALAGVCLLEGSRGSLSPLEIMPPAFTSCGRRHAAQADTLSNTMLWDTFASGLHPMSLKSEIT